MIAAMIDIKVVIISALLGLLFFLSPGGFTVSLVVLLVVLKKNIKADAESRFIMNLFMAAFLLRLLLLFSVSAFMVSRNEVLFYPGYPGWSVKFIGDSAYYTLRGYWMSLDWRGFFLTQKVLGSAYNPVYGWQGYNFIIAGFNYLFGFSPVSSAIMNCLFGSLIPVVCYYVCRQVFSLNVSRISALLMAFFPSLLLWSITNLKDASLILVILCIFWLFIKLTSYPYVRQKIILFFAIFIALFILSTLRKFIMPIVLLSLFITALAVSGHPRLKVKIFIVLIIIFSSIVLFRLSPAKIDKIFRQKIFRVLSLHQASAKTPGNNYRILEDKYYILNPYFVFGKQPDEECYVYPANKLSYGQYIMAYMRGLFHFIFEPNIFRPVKKTMFLAYPQMLLWYIMVLLSPLGLFISLRYAWKRYLILLIYSFLLVSALSLTQANIGTVLRFRDMITPVVAIWAAIGITKISGKKILKEQP